jgi:hypothetical protein
MVQVRLVQAAIVIVSISSVTLIAWVLFVF